MRAKALEYYYIFCFTTNYCNLWFYCFKTYSVAYGSDVNGLVSSITQFLGYIALVEGGVGGVIRAALYKPLAK